MSCLFQLHEENVQDFLQDNLGRRLTKKELNRIKMAFLENDDIQWMLADIMYTAGKDAINNADDRWSVIDKDFADGKELFPELNCKEK